MGGYFQLKILCKYKVDLGSCRMFHDAWEDQFTALIFDFVLSR